MPKRLRLLYLLLLCPAPALSQETELEILPDVRRYTVEVIVFGYAQQVATGSEVFVPDIVEVREIDLETLPTAREMPPPGMLVPGLDLDKELVLLDEQDFSLVEVYDMLERLDVYEPLMHFGWTQSTWPDHEKEALSLLTFGTPPEGLDGELTLYLSRYLHLVIDLSLDAPQIEDSFLDEPAYSYGDYRSFSNLREPLQPGVVRYRIEEDRIFRSGELRYFDHPKFGVLAKVTRLEEEEVEESEGELLGYPLE